MRHGRVRCGLTQVRVEASHGAQGLETCLF